LKAGINNSLRRLPTLVLVFESCTRRLFDLALSPTVGIGEASAAVPSSRAGAEHLTKIQRTLEADASCARARAGQTGGNTIELTDSGYIQDVWSVVRDGSREGAREDEEEEDGGQ